MIWIIKFANNQEIKVSGIEPMHLRAVLAALHELYGRIVEMKLIGF